MCGKGVCIGGLYRLQIDSMKHGALVYDSTKLCELWHMCPSHLHYWVFTVGYNLQQGCRENTNLMIVC
jgi:hypothetical protein